LNKPFYDVILGASVATSIGESVAFDVSSDIVSKEALEFGGNAARSVVMGSANGVVGGASQTVLDNVIAGRKWDVGLGRAVWMVALTGGIAG
jgi:hypothetical protein